MGLTCTSWKNIVKGILAGLFLVMAILAFSVTNLTDRGVIMVSRSAEKYYACPTFPGRLGNHIYQYASVIGLAKLYNLTVILGKNDGITKYFNVPSAVIRKDRSICKRFELKQAQYCCRFDESFLHLTRKSYRFGTYLQSWKYFEDSFADIRSELGFKKSIKQQAQVTVESYRKEYMLKHGVDKVLVVGVHVRQGDIAEKDMKGDIFVPEAYIYRAMDYFLTKYSFASVIFVVCSDGMEYVKHLIDYKNVTSLFVNASPIQDIAVLASCDHVIMTYGTFGWWAGFLAGGEVVYYKYPIMEKSRLIDSYNYDEFFPTSWIGLE